MQDITIDDGVNIAVKYRLSRLRPGDIKYKDSSHLNVAINDLHTCAVLSHPRALRIPDFEIFGLAWQLRKSGQRQEEEATS